jgi:ribonuclease HI
VGKEVKIEAYSDGSGTTAKTPGGYGFVVVVDGVKQYEGSGHLDFATNNDCELQGAIEGLDSLHYHFEQEELTDVWLVSDSEIILGWASGERAFKQEEKILKYQQLTNMMSEFKAKTRWVHGHSGEVFNERCDVLANAARKNEVIS